MTQGRESVMPRSVAPFLLLSVSLKFVKVDKYGDLLLRRTSTTDRLDRAVKAAKRMLQPGLSAARKKIPLFAFERSLVVRREIS